MSSEELYWDPFSMDNPDPYPMLARLRDEAPLYYNKQYDFYALSRYDDCEAALKDRDLYSSARGSVIDLIKANIQIPRGFFIFHDPPLHTIYRNLFARMFTPKRLAALEPKIREFCRSALDPLVGADKFDFVEDLGSQMPMRVIGMLLGVPEADQQDVRQRADDRMRNATGKPKDYNKQTFFVEGFEEYLDWRVKNPSEDIMTELLNVEFEDETGQIRRLRRDETMVILNLLVTAGNETTNKLIGWSGKVLADNPDQRRQVYADRSLLPQTIEEILRYESPAPHLARVNVKEVEYYGTKIPEGSAVAFLTQAANRDERKFVHGDKFDIHRPRFPHLTFGYGWHTCMGNMLARIEGRIALDEVLNRFPEWDVDLGSARMVQTSTVRGFESLPVYVH